MVVMVEEQGGLRPERRLMELAAVVTVMVTVPIIKEIVSVSMSMSAQASM